MSCYSPRTKNSPGFEELNEENYPVFAMTQQRTLRKDELVVKFNVFYPIDNQIKKVKEKIDSIKKDITVNPTRDKKYGETDKIRLITCLRLLDALDDKKKKAATEEEILFYIYWHKFKWPNEIKSPDQIEERNSKSKERYSKYDKNEIKNLKEVMKDNIKEATELCDGGYVSLVKSVSHYLNKTLDKEEVMIMKEI